MDFTEKYPLGSRPSIHFLPYLIFISYIVSLIGAFTTVELLHRRVSGTGWRSWVQLLACSVSFGLVAIWCMHFVGNRAIVLGDGEEEIQLYYNSTFTAVSAILPIVVIFLGFSVADRFYRGSRGSSTRHAALLICGVLSGAAVTEMHYLGNQGTTNYRLKPSWEFIVGAASIAVVACVISFGLFFHWSGHWMNNIWRRFIVACVLAVAVSGMHWTASAGTTYELKGYHNGPGQEKNINLIIAVCLCLGACSVCFALGFLKQLHQRKLKDRAQHVVLAVATFDGEGRILVNQAGLLPCQTITRQFIQKTFDDDFSTSHLVFQWIFRISRYWGGIIDLIPAMREHLHSTGHFQVHSPVIRSASQAGSPPGPEDISIGYSATFRQLFCVAAHDIAKSLDTRLQDLGSLYEDVLTTGTLLTQTPWKDTHGTKNIVAANVANISGDIEAGIANPILFGKGQLLVLTRKVATEESNRLQNAGYRFAHLDQISDPLARSMQVSRDDLYRLVGRLQSFCERETRVPTQGIYLTSFLLQPSPSMKGLDVIVPRNAPDQLPMVKLTSNGLAPAQVKILSYFNGLTLDGCMVRIDQLSGLSARDDIFLEKFRHTIHELLKTVNEPALRRATFSSQQLDITPVTTRQNDAITATVFAFCGIKEVNDRSLQSNDMQYVPLSFFQCFQRTYPGCPDHAIFAQKNHREFSTIFSSFEIDTPTSSADFGRKWPTLWSFVKSPSTSEITVNNDSSSERGLVKIGKCASIDSNNNNSSHPFGIMVSQDITISEDHKGGSQLELSELGVRSEASVADREQQTMADKLMTITTSFHGRR
ncbi:hypothetical protein K505DRAFT_374462 [Melanomma pulvis-pyrius CBS 109.77]|uniref:MHYT domain-containing protein n=1 Tax=Melanomma pulvis-pyrius CBS 109.77 TaxID=1314802 RepID=A0A6A6XG35_9PLEO|nr:hypothetical protein K505DRAFT_374462 [Melanomma pulvis-pyrius CBS 109.77]